MVYQNVCVGGTFDFLHKGHRALLEKAFEIGENVVIGLSSEKLAEEKQARRFEKRLEELTDYLIDNQLEERCRIEIIDDFIGPAVSPELEAIVVTQETRNNAERINKGRAKRQLNPLKIIEIPLVLADNGEPVSSTAIRRGIMDREGKVSY